MISSVRYTSPATAVAITMADGTVWHTDASLPPDTDIRRALAEWLDAGNEPEPYEAAAPPPITLTNRQLFAALALAGLITTEEALAAGRTGEVPAAIEAVFASLPPQDAFLARLTWATMREVPRDHPLIAAMVAAQLATPQQVDALFALGASIP
ncbi:hypothetical protein [Synechococcus phage MinM1]|nr:hypothetical protein [Synechococcus phage MinM1]